MKVYVTKYALTRGILLMEVVDIMEDYCYSYSLKKYYYKGQFFISATDALIDAEQRKEKKLIQLHNQISKLENKNVTIIKEV